MNSTAGTRNSPGLPRNADYHGRSPYDYVSGYFERAFRADPAWRGRQVIFLLDELSRSQKGTLYLNGRKLADPAGRRLFRNSAAGRTAEIRRGQFPDHPRRRRRRLLELARNQRRHRASHQTAGHGGISGNRHLRNPENHNLRTDAAKPLRRPGDSPRRSANRGRGRSGRLCLSGRHPRPRRGENDLIRRQMGESPALEPGHPPSLHCALSTEKQLRHPHRRTGAGPLRLPRIRTARTRLLPERQQDSPLQSRRLGQRKLGPRRSAPRRPDAEASRATTAYARCFRSRPKTIIRTTSCAYATKRGCFSS